MSITTLIGLPRLEDGPAGYLKISGSRRGFLDLSHMTPQVVLRTLSRVMVFIYFFFFFNSFVGLGAWLNKLSLVTVQLL
jgi:hypothetical protein